MRALTDSLREIAGRDDLFIMIDQEGGRVARMRPPQWPAFPAAGQFAALYDAAPSSAIEAARCNARALGGVLAQAGITDLSGYAVDPSRPLLPDLFLD